MTITLGRGDEVEIELRLPEGMSWPKDVKPQVYFDAQKDGDLAALEQRQTSGHRTADSRHQLAGAAPVGTGFGDAPAIGPDGAVSDRDPCPRLFAYFESPVLTASEVKQGKIVIDVPRPGQIELGFSPKLAEGEKLPFDRVLLSLGWKLPDLIPNGVQVLNQGEMKQPWEPWHVKDLAPGSYRMFVRKSPAEQKTAPNLRTALSQPIRAITATARRSRSRPGKTRRSTSRSSPTMPTSFAATTPPSSTSC